MEPSEKYKQPEQEDLFDLPDLDLESKPFAEICCPKCNEAVAADDLNINDKIAKCSSCAVVFSFQDTIQHISSVPQKLKQEILRPEGIDLFYYKGELEVSFKQPISSNEWVYLLTTPFIGLTGFINYIENGLPTILLLISLLPMLIGIYYIIQRIRHKVYLTIDGSTLRIKLKPNTLKKNTTYDVNEIDQLYVSKSKKSARFWDIMMLVNRGKGQEHVKLTSVKSASKAKFLEQELERHLKIQDVVVPEED